MLVHRFLAKKKTVIMLQLQYSPGLIPAEFFLFPKLNTQMKGKGFAMIQDVKEKSAPVDILLFPKLKTSMKGKCFAMIEEKNRNKSCM